MCESGWLSSSFLTVSVSLSMSVCALHWGCSDLKFSLAVRSAAFWLKKINANLHWLAWNALCQYKIRPRLLSYKICYLNAKGRIKYIWKKCKKEIISFHLTKTFNNFRWSRWHLIKWILTIYFGRKRAKLIDNSNWSIHIPRPFKRRKFSIYLPIYIYI